MIKLIGNGKNKRAMRSLRRQIIRDRTKGVSDEASLARFVYRTGFSSSLVDKFYTTLIDSGTLPDTRTDTPQSLNTFPILLGLNQE